MRVSVFTSFVLSLLVSVHCAGAILREQCFNETTGLPCYCIAPAKNMTYILVSTGGAGSLTMTAFLERYSDDVYHLHDPYPPDQLTEPTDSAYASKWNRDDRVNVETNTGMVKGRKRGLIFGNQTFPAFGESLNSTLVLFLYRNAVNTIVSHGNADICRRVRHQKDKKRVASHMCLGLQGSNETAIHQHYAKEGRDVFQLRRYFHHYIKPRSPHNYRTVGFKFEALWSDFDEIARALCLPPGTEYEQETTHKKQSQRIDNTSLQLLEDMYAGLNDEISATPNVIVVDPQVYWRGDPSQPARDPRLDYRRVGRKKKA